MRPGSWVTALTALPVVGSGLDEELRLAARVDLPTVITADSRAVRQACARVIHDDSDRRLGPFVRWSPNSVETVSASSSMPVVVGCAEGNLLAGRFDQARGGTLFIDDIFELSADVQSRLFELLEDRIALDVRVIAGASRHFERERSHGTFSDLLFYRLNVVHIDFAQVE